MSEVTKEYIESIAAMNGYRDICEKEGHGIVAIMPLAFTHAIISECTPYGYGDRWCFHSYFDAKRALDEWGDADEPTGWHRHPKSGRRYNEDGKLEVYY